MQSKDFGGRLSGVFGDLLVRRFSVREPEIFRVIETVSSQRLTSINKAALCELAQVVMDTEFDGLEGDFVQAGCGLGGAAIVMAHAKRRNRSLTVYDPFAQSIQGADQRLNLKLVPGLYEETVAEDGALALAHLDCSQYNPMRVLLERLTPRLVPGGQLIIDDYKTKEECQKAVDDYFRGKSGFKFVRQSRLHVIKTSSLL